MNYWKNFTAGILYNPPNMQRIKCIEFVEEMQFIIRENSYLLGVVDASDGARI